MQIVFRKFCLSYQLIKLCMRIGNWEVVKMWIWHSMGLTTFRFTYCSSLRVLLLLFFKHAFISFMRWTFSQTEGDPFPNLYKNSIENDLHNTSQSQNCYLYVVICCNHFIYATKEQTDLCLMDLIIVLFNFFDFLCFFF